MKSNRTKSDYVLVGLVIVTMVFVLIASGVFYFNFVSGGTLFNAKVVYGQSDSDSKYNNSVVNNNSNIKNSEGVLNNK